MKESRLEKLKWAFIFWLARRLPDCKTMTPILGESLDRKLSLREKLTSKLHLFTCQACANYLKQVKFLREAIHIQEKIFTKEKDFSDSKMSIEAKERIKNALKSSIHQTS
jgi:hypothetical protein